MNKHTYSVYIKKEDDDLLWTSGQSYVDCLLEVDFLKKYEGIDAYVEEDQNSQNARHPQ